MVWFRVDDVITFHPRVIEAGNAAMGLWLRAGAWSMNQLSDGLIPNAVARQLGSPSEIRRLVSTGLWEAIDGGYQFHAWAEAGDGTVRQPTREQVHAKRESDRKRKQDTALRGVEARKNPRGSGPDSARKPPGMPADSESVPEPPVPARPVPATPDGVATPKTPGGEPPDVFAPTDRFAEFWEIYPRTVDKPAARRAWTKALKTTDPDVIIDGARRYADDPNRIDQFTKHPGPWLNAEAWNNPPLPARTTGRESSLDRRDRQVAQTFADLAHLEPLDIPRGALGA